MEKPVSICRVCRNENGQLIETQLQEIYENFTAILTTEVAPLSLCYICLAQLKASRRFKCLKAVKIFRRMLEQLRANVIVLIYPYEVQKAILINQLPLNQLTIGPVEHTIIDSDAQNVDIFIKDEEDINVKNEINNLFEEDVKREKWEEQSIQGDHIIKNPKLELQSKFICDICKKSFNEESNLTSHLFVHKNEIPNDDNVCMTNDTEKCYVTIHARKNTGETLVSNARTVKKHTDEKCFFCDVCNKIFTQKRNLTLHTRVHTGEKPHVCNVCSKRFQRKWDLTLHTRVHTDEKPHVCNVCSKPFKQKKHLTLHTRLHTEEKPHVCNVCNKKFKQKRNLTLHTRVHTSEKPHVCNVCNKSFKRKWDLTIHTRLHTGERPHVCNVCNKGFKQKRILALHTRVHTGEKPHLCNVCNKRFQRKWDLTIHTRLHTGESPHVCNVCNKGFKQKWHLTLHTRLHTGEKPHVCSVCNKRFKQKRNLTLHRRLHTGERPYICNVCNDTFVQKIHLRLHERKHTHKIL